MSPISSWRVAWTANVSWPFGPRWARRAGRLASQLFGESVVLGLLGGGAGVLIATWAISLIGGLIPGDVPGIDRLAIDWRVLGVALTLSLGAALLFGTAPAWRASRVDAGEVVRESSLRVAGSRRVGRARGALVAGQLALSLGLVAGAALAAQSFASLARLDPGFRSRRASSRPRSS